jgi:hypothetical protein
MAKPKKLKRIPADLVPYVQIEGEAIRDANDKMLIVSYAYSKLEKIDWYLELLAVDSKNYIVPQSKEYLENVKRDLLAAVKTIMDTKIPSPKDSGFTYPKGYEG